MPYVSNTIDNHARITLVSADRKYNQNVLFDSGNLQKKFESDGTVTDEVQIVLTRQNNNVKFMDHLKTGNYLLMNGEYYWIYEVNFQDEGASSVKQVTLTAERLQIHILETVQIFSAQFQVQKKYTIDDFIAILNGEIAKITPSWFNFELTTSDSVGSKTFKFNDDDLPDSSTSEGSSALDFLFTVINKVPEFYCFIAHEAVTAGSSNVELMSTNDANAFNDRAAGETGHDWNFGGQPIIQIGTTGTGSINFNAKDVKTRMRGWYQYTDPKDKNYKWFKHVTVTLNTERFGIIDAPDFNHENSATAESNENPDGSFYLNDPDSLKSDMKTYLETLAVDALSVSNELTHNLKVTQFFPSLGNDVWLKDKALGINIKGKINEVNYDLTGQAYPTISVTDFYRFRKQVSWVKKLHRVITRDKMGKIYSNY